jgi:3-phenylpropionate/cinnamic acid dioxygenase small subunit
MGPAHGEGAAMIDRAAAEDFLFREALFLDRRDWDAWLALYAEDAVFWIPAWRDETQATEDPDRELSLIYYRGRRNLEERVWRIRSGLSVASTVLPRAVHSVTNVLVENADETGAQVSASFAVHLNDVRASREHVFFGRYEYTLQKGERGPVIASKKILLLNDTIPAVLDFYLV